MAKGSQYLILALSNDYIITKYAFISTDEDCIRCSLWSVQFKESRPIQ